MGKPFSETGFAKAMNNVASAGNSILGAINPIYGLASKAIQGIGSLFKDPEKQARKEAELQYEYEQKSADAQQKRNIEMMDYQHQLNLSDWERENEYNTPQAQMERLGEAGINPLSAMSSVAAQSGNISPVGVQAGGSGVATIPTTESEISALYRDYGLQSVEQALDASRTLPRDLQVSIAEGIKALNESSKQLNEFSQGFVAEQTDEARSRTLINDVTYRKMLKTFDTEVAIIDQRLLQAIETTTGMKFDNIRKFWEGKNEQETYRLINTQIASLEQGIKESMWNCMLRQAEIGLTKATEALRWSETEHEAVKALLTYFNVEGAEMANYLTWNTMPYEIEGSRLRVAHHKQVNEWYPKEMKQRVGLMKMMKVTGWINTSMNVLNTATNIGSAFATGGLSSAVNSQNMKGMAKRESLFSPDVVNTIEKMTLAGEMSKFGGLIF